MAFFDATKVAPDQGRGDPFPAGWYVVTLVKLDIGPTKDNEGVRANGEFEVADGQYKGRKVWHGFNMMNKNEKAQEIAHKQMSALCHAVGVLIPEAPEQLFGRPLKIRAKVTPADGANEAKNEITAFKDVNDPSAVNPAASTSAPSSSAALAAAPKPWSAPAVAAAPAQAPVAAQPPQWQAPVAQQPWNQPAAEVAAAVVEVAAVVSTVVAPQEQPSAPAGIVPPWMPQ